MAENSEVKTSCVHLASAGGGWADCGNDGDLGRGVSHVLDTRTEAQA